MLPIIKADGYQKPMVKGKKATGFYVGATVIDGPIRGGSERAVSKALHLDSGLYNLCPITSSPCESRYYLRIFAKKRIVVTPI
jgi:hypothetical protein